MYKQSLSTVVVVADLDVEAKYNAFRNDLMDKNGAKHWLAADESQTLHTLAHNSKEDVDEICGELKLQSRGRLREFWARAQVYSGTNM